MKTEQTEFSTQVKTPFIKEKDNNSNTPIIRLKITNVAKVINPFIVKRVNLKRFVVALPKM